MQITSELADQIYSILVATIGPPNDENRRWSFCYSVVKLHVTEYTIDSSLGMGAKIRLGEVPYIFFPPKIGENELRTIKIKQANRALVKVAIRKAPSVARVLTEATAILKSPITAIEHPGPVAAIADENMSVLQRTLIEAIEPQSVIIE